MIKALDWEGVPPRLPQEPIFYPVMNEPYAQEISEKWNEPAYGAGHVASWQRDAVFSGRYPGQNVGSTHHNELWVPAEELEEFNQNILGKISLIATYGKIKKNEGKQLTTR